MGLSDRNATMPSGAETETELARVALVAGVSCPVKRHGDLKPIHTAKHIQKTGHLKPIHTAKHIQKTRPPQTHTHCKTYTKDTATSNPYTLQNLYKRHGHLKPIHTAKHIQKTRPPQTHTHCKTYTKDTATSNPYTLQNIYKRHGHLKPIHTAKHIQRLTEVVVCWWRNVPATH